VTRIKPLTHAPISEPDDRTAAIIDALAPLLAQHRQRWAARCHARGISILGFQVLALLEMHGAMPMGHLADELGVALPNATGLVNRMAERGLVGRHDDATDRRVVRVELTDAGRRLIGEMDAERRDRMRRLFGSLGPAQQARLLEAVKDLSAAARKLHDTEEGHP
jgi:DNA-binding MarR family transcriptional regulator